MENATASLRETVLFTVMHLSSLGTVSPAFPLLILVSVLVGES